MRAMVCSRLEGPESLSLEERPDPVPGPGEVLIEVEAAGINFADGLITTGRYQVKPELPFIPGFEVAGRIGGFGPETNPQGLEIGQRVLALLDYGGFAERSVTRVEDVFPIPDAMTMAAAGGFPIAYGTAHLGLVKLARLSPVQTLLVHGAAGGVGLTAVEIGRAVGATVIGTAGGRERMEVAKMRGCDHVIDYREENVRERVLALTEGRGVDVTYDPVGGQVFEDSLRCTAPGGRLLVVGFASGTIPQIAANQLLVRNLTVSGYWYGAWRRLDPKRVADSMHDLFGWWEDGLINPLTTATYPLEQTQQALTDLKGRRYPGKLVVMPRE